MLNLKGGTRELFMSNFVLFYQALDTAGQTLKLDIYEGMPYVFQVKARGLPESMTALKKMDDFLTKYFKK